MRVELLPGAPNITDIQMMVEQLGQDAVECYLLVNIYHLRRKASQMPGHKEAQYLYTAAWYAARYQEVVHGKT